MENRVIYLSFKRGDGIDVYERHRKYINDLGSLVSFSPGGKFACVTTTIACLEKNNWLEDLDYEFDFPTYHQKPVDLVMNYYNSENK